jgi:hypothetical protein
MAVMGNLFLSIFSFNGSGWLILIRQKGILGKFYRNDSGG